MRDNDSPPHNVGHSKNFEQFGSSHPLFITFFQMILDAIVTSQNHGSGQSQHLLYLGGECPFHISIGIDIVVALLAVGMEVLIIKGYKKRKNAE